MRIAYFDCFSGASGDMILGALLAAGVSESELTTELKRIPNLDWQLKVEPVLVRGISAIRVLITSHDHVHERNLEEIFALLDAGTLAPDILEQVRFIFRLIAEAEATIHGTTPESIHFHELGGIDSILDIVGAVVGLKLLGVEKIYASALPLSHGTVRCAHGEFPVPAPAVLELLKGVPFYSTDVEGELITPTGAGILKAYAESFGGVPPFRLEACGYGAGSRDLGSRPNVLRLQLGEADLHALPDASIQSLVLLETNIDDMNPELYDYVMERLFAVGALDVFLSPLQMKKNRPATRLSVLCAPEIRAAALDVLLSETTTLGVRMHTVERVSRKRHGFEVDTPYGRVRVKAAGPSNQPDWIAPEYDDCAARARTANVPVRKVYEAARAAAGKTD